MKNQTNISMSSWWGNDNTRERQRQRGKNNNNHKEKNKDHLKQNKLEHRVTQPMQRCCVRGYHRLGREQDKTANNRYWDYVRLSMGLISAPQTMHPEDAYSLGVFWRSAWPDTHSPTAPRGYMFIRVGTIRTPHCPHHLNRNIIIRIVLQEAQH